MKAFLLKVIERLAIWDATHTWMDNLAVFLMMFIIAIVVYCRSNGGFSKDEGEEENE